MRQSIANLIGFFWGWGLVMKATCDRCGAPCRDYLPYRVQVRYDRHFCRNKLCNNYVPF